MILYCDVQEGWMQWYFCIVLQIKRMLLWLFILRYSHCFSLSIFMLPRFLPRKNKTKQQQQLWRFCLTICWNKIKITFLKFSKDWAYAQQDASVSLIQWENKSFLQKNCAQETTVPERCTSEAWTVHQFSITEIVLSTNLHLIIWFFYALCQTGELLNHRSFFKKHASMYTMQKNFLCNAHLL